MADITAEFVSKILSLAPDEKIVDAQGLEYHTKQLTALKPPVPAKIEVKTLTALVTLLTCNFEGMADKSPVFHVVDPLTVAVFTKQSDDYGQRTAFVTAKQNTEDDFVFGSWKSQEDFIIAMNSRFLQYGDRDSILSVVSKLETDDRLTIEDDGFHQTATAKASVSRNAQVDLKPRVLLKPFRTFREVEQPPSEFILRIKRGQTGLPLVAPFEADGGRWRLDAMQNVAEYLYSKVATEPVVY